jgi:hypothetical protein
LRIRFSRLELRATAWFKKSDNTGRPDMRLFGLELIAPTLSTAETRCGWYDNPTPGNVFFDDADTKLPPPPG